MQKQSGIPVAQRLLTNNDPVQLLEQQQKQQLEESAVVAAASLPPTLLLYDDELPGGGQFYCVETAKHFIDATALADHKKTKFYKRRVKELQQQTHHTQKTAEWAAGKTKEVLPPVRNNNNNNSNTMNLS